MKLTDLFSRDATPVPVIRELEGPGPVWAIGDIHGQDDALARLQGRIAEATSGTSATLIMLGDYVDRGPASAMVLDRMLAEPPKGIERICIRGNHEAAMLDFLEEPRRDHMWLAVGGDATLASYGIYPHSARSDRSLARMLDCAIPTEHRRFLETGLVDAVTWHDTLFVHAGLEPRRPLQDQTRQDLNSIRSRFLEAEGPFTHRVVHGHTPVAAPEIHPHRINIDTGATGRLTAACFNTPSAAPDFIEVETHDAYA